MKSVMELDAKICRCTDALTAKLDGSNGKRAILLCGGTGCLSSNSMDIKEKFDALVAINGLNEKVTTNTVGCFGFCSQGPFVKILPEDTLYRLVKVEDVEEIFNTDILGGQIVERLLYVEPNTGEKVSRQDDINFYKKQKRVALHGGGVINPEDIHEAMGYGAFQGLKRALSMEPKAVIDEVLASGLRGRGGGGFPTGRKWQFAYNSVSDQKYVVCNGDEGDPGAFMDRSILEGNPYAVIEGMMIAGYAIGASEGYFYVRAEYPIAVNRLRNAIKQMNEAGILGQNILGTGFNFQAHIRLGAGAFVCGEETALMRSIEGMRGEPTPKPPFPAVRGLFDKPSNINNVETYANIPQIILKGADWFTSIGTEKSPGTKAFALTGNIKNTGLIEVPMGTTLREIIFDIGGGMRGDGEFKAVQIGGPSGACLTKEHLDLPLDFDTLKKVGAMIGSGGMVVMDSNTCMVEVARFFMNFTQNESCGKCVPCREGTKRMLGILERIVAGEGEDGDIELLLELADTISATALCGLGKSAPSPVVSTIQNFRDEYEAHIYEKRCPAGACQKLKRISIDRALCKGCTKCARLCPVGAISGKVKEAHTIDLGKCIRCGSCIEACAFHAITEG